MQIFASTTFLGDEPTNLAEPLGLLADLPLDGVELGSTHVWRPDLANEVSRLWQKPILTHNYFPPAEQGLVLNIASADVDIRQQSIAHMKHCIRFAADIGATHYTIHPGFMAEPVSAGSNRQARTFDFNFATENTPHERAFKLMVEALSDLLEAATKAGVGLAIETEGSMTSAGVTLMETPEEYECLYRALPEGLGVTLNIAHSTLAARSHGFEVAEFVEQIRSRIVAVELSHNDGLRDQHRPLESGAPVLAWPQRLPDVPMILEFRCASQNDVLNSIEILRGLDTERKMVDAG